MGGTNDVMFTSLDNNAQLTILSGNWFQRTWPCRDCLEKEALPIPEENQTTSSGVSPDARLVFLYFCAVPFSTPIFRIVFDPFPFGEPLTAKVWPTGQASLFVLPWSKAERRWGVAKGVGGAANAHLDKTSPDV